MPFGLPGHPSQHQYHLLQQLNPCLIPPGQRGSCACSREGVHFYASTLLAVYTEEVMSAFTPCCSRSCFVRRGLQVRLVSVLHSITQMCMGRVQGSSKIIMSSKTDSSVCGFFLHFDCVLCWPPALQ